MTTVKFSVPNISCGHCVHTIQTELQEMEGVESAAADLATRQVVVVFAPPASEEKIRELLKSIDYPADE